MKGLKLIALLLMVITVLSCNKDLGTSEPNFNIDTRVTSSIVELDSCLTIVFPVDVIYPDGTQKNYADDVALYADLEMWEDNNPDATVEPQFIYPIEIILGGTTNPIIINDEMTLLGHADGCEDDDHGNGGDDEGDDPDNDEGGIILSIDSCFALIYPLQVINPDSLAEIFNSEADLLAAILVWEGIYNDIDDHVTFVFPIEVLIEGNVENTIISNYNELEEIEEICEGEEVDGENEVYEVLINIDDLLQSIKDYVSINYPDALIIKASLEDNEYEVELDNGWELVFDINGVFLRIDNSETLISPTDLLQNIKDYIAANYPNNTIVEATLEHNEYKVELNNDLEIIFDINGNFLRIEN